MNRNMPPVGAGTSERLVTLGADVLLGLVRPLLAMLERVVLRESRLVLEGPAAVLANEACVAPNLLVCQHVPGQVTGITKHFPANCTS